MTNDYRPPVGTVTMHGWRDPADGTEKVRIDRADPQVTITDELLRQVANGDWEPWITVEPAPGWPHPLHVRDSFGHHYIYRIGEYDPDARIWELSWPD